MTGYVITVYPGGRVSAEEYRPASALKQVQHAVGGYIETVPLMETVEFGPVILALEIRDLPAFEQPCVAFCNEDGKVDGLPVNITATQLWAESLVSAGHARIGPNGKIPMSDVLVGPVAFVVGADALAHWNRPE